MRMRFWFTLFALGLAALVIARGGPLPPSTTHAQAVITAKVERSDAAGESQAKGHGLPILQPLGSADPLAEPANRFPVPEQTATYELRPIFGIARTGKAGLAAPSAARSEPPAGSDAPAAPAGPAAQTCTVGSLAAGAATDGLLDDGDCRLPQVIGGDNPSYVDQYRVDLTERGRLTVNVGRRDFDPYVAILDDQYYVIAESTSAGAAAETGLVLPAGTFIVVVGAAGATADTQGAYRLTTVFEPEATPQNCTATKPLAPGGSAGGALAVGDCRLFDVLPGVFSDSYVQLYAITVPQAGALNLEMRSTSLRAIIILADTHLNAFNAGRASDASPDALTLTSYVRAGTYVAIVSSASAATGGYTLNAGFAASTADCTPAETPADATVTGRLAPDGCHLSYLPNGSNDQSPVVLYRIVLPQEGDYEIQVRAQGFVPVLRGYNIHYGDALSRPLVLPPGAKATLIWDDASTLILAVGAAEGGAVSGDFTAELDFKPSGPADCSVAELGPTAAVDGQLGITDCRLLDISSLDLPYDSRADQYRVTVSQHGKLSVVMTSSAFDTHLVSFDENFVLLSQMAANDGRNTRMDLEVYPGTYVILASSISASAGAYRLTTTFQPSPKPASCPIKPIQPSADVTGALTTASCRTTDLVPGSPTQEYVERYRLTLPARGHIVIEQHPTEGAAGLEDTLLEVYDPITYARIARNDDIDFANQDYDSKIDTFLPKGEYLIHASAAKVIGGVPPGGFRLSTRFTAQPAPATCQGNTLGLSARELGDLDQATSCLIFDSPLGGFSGLPLRWYPLHVPQAGVLGVDLQALGFDPRLEIYDPRWTLLRFNDDKVPGVDLNSQIVWSAPPGFYLVAAVSSDGAAGDYLLDTEFEPEEYEPPPAPTPTRPIGATPTRTSTPTPPGEVTPTGKPVDVGKIYMPYGAKEAARP